MKRFLQIMSLERQLNFLVMLYKKVMDLQGGMIIKSLQGKGYIQSSVIDKKYKIHGNQEYTCIIDDSYMKSKMECGVGLLNLQLIT